MSHLFDPVYLRLTHPDLVLAIRIGCLVVLGVCGLIICAMAMGTGDADER